MLTTALIPNCNFPFQKKHLFDDPFERYEFSMYLLKTDGGTKLMKQWIDKYGQMKIKDFTDYAKIYGFFRKGQKYFGVSDLLSNHVQCL